MYNFDMNKIAITTGDINGIGTEVTLKALSKLNLQTNDIILISNSKIIDYYQQKLNLKTLPYKIIEIPFSGKISPGTLTKESGEFSFLSLEKACEIAKNKEISAIVTAPVSKEALHLAGHKFSGQTEVLQHFLAHDGQHAEMLFVAKDFKVLLLTRHLALKDIKLNKNEIIDKICDLNIIFKKQFKIHAPKFALCGLNPHAGEDGILGSEEIEILNPAVDILRAKGINITYPKPADTLFAKAAKEYLTANTPLFNEGRVNIVKSQMSYDCYIACYHDQGLIPIKAVAFDKTVNTTIGLDVIRTSPSHGTAFDIAGKGLAEEASMTEAIKLAFEI